MIQAGNPRGRSIQYECSIITATDSVSFITLNLLYLVYRALFTFSLADSAGVFSFG